MPMDSRDGPRVIEVEPPLPETRYPTRKVHFPFPHKMPRRHSPDNDDYYSDDEERRPVYILSAKNTAQTILPSAKNAAQIIMPSAKNAAQKFILSARNAARGGLLHTTPRRDTMKRRRCGRQR